MYSTYLFSLTLSVYIHHFHVTSSCLSQHFGGLSLLSSLPPPSMPPSHTLRKAYKRPRYECSRWYGSLTFSRNVFTVSMKSKLSKVCRFDGRTVKLLATERLLIRLLRITKHLDRLRGAGYPKIPEEHTFPLTSRACLFWFWLLARKESKTYVQKCQHQRLGPEIIAH